MPSSLPLHALHDARTTFSPASRTEINVVRCHQVTVNALTRQKLRCIAARQTATLFHWAVGVDDKFVSVQWHMPGIECAGETVPLTAMGGRSVRLGQFVTMYAVRLWRLLQRARQAAPLLRVRRARVGFEDVALLCDMVAVDRALSTCALSVPHARIFFSKRMPVLAVLDLPLLRTTTRQASPANSTRIRRVVDELMTAHPQVIAIGIALPAPAMPLQPVHGVCLVVAVSTGTLDNPRCRPRQVHRDRDRLQVVGIAT
ncbi:hypothetical protein RhoFasSB10_03947 [Rhodococcus fascians]|nr:hypothetical protein [Rhodococcus fascians]